MLTVFNEKLFAERTPIIELNGAYPVSDLRDDQQTSGSGAITDSGSEFRVRHQASEDFARLASASRGRYQPGNSAECGIGVRFDSVPTSGDFVAYWGYFDMELDGNNNNKETIKNGIVFGVDKDGTFVEMIKDGVSQDKVYQGNFNIRNSDLKLKDGNIFQIEFTYYGYGPIKFQYLETSEDGVREVYDLHVMQRKGATTLSNSNLQVGGLVKSSNTGEDFSMFIGGRQFAIIGDYRPRSRTNSEFVTTSGDTVGTSGFTPIISFRRKASRRETAVAVLGFDVSNNTDQIIEIRVKGTLTNASFGDLSNQVSGETALEVDTSATDIDTTTGVQVYQLYAPSTGNKNTFKATQTGELFVDVPDEANITFSSKAVSTDGDISINPRIEEVN